MKDDSIDFGFDIITEYIEIVNKNKKDKNEQVNKSEESSQQYNKQYTDDADILQSILNYSKDRDIKFLY